MSSFLVRAIDQSPEAQPIVPVASDVVPVSLSVPRCYYCGRDNDEIALDAFDDEDPSVGYAATEFVCVECQEQRGGVRS